jgi:hypothetical protein
MSGVKYDPADHGKIRGSLHIDDVKVSDDRSTARITVRQRNQPEIEVVYFFGLSRTGQPYMINRDHVQDVMAEWWPE